MEGLNSMNKTAFTKKIWLSSPTSHEEELKYIHSAFDTNWISTAGENINEIERIFPEYLGCRAGVALSSGTSALHMAIKLADIKAEENVFCSDLTFIATVNPVLYEKAKPIFIDSEYETWNMDPVALEKAFKLFPNTRVVIVANLYGTPAKLDEIANICKEHGAIMIEDAAESLGATYKGKETGTFGDFNCISFNGNKIITGSSGGMLLTDDEAAAQKVRKWSTQAREKALWYQHEELGFNYRMSNLIAGVVRGQFHHLDEHILEKKRLYDRYSKGFFELPISMNPYDKGISNPNYWLSCMLIEKDFMSREVKNDFDYLYSTERGKTSPMEIIDKLAEFNVESRPIWKPMHMQPIFSNNTFITKEGIANGGSNAYSDNGRYLSVGEDIFNRGICLPSDITMTNDEQDKIIEIVKACFE